MVTHHVLVATTGHINVTLNPVVMRVTTTSELPSALSQRTNSVVIDNPELECKLSRIEFWQGREGTYRFLGVLIASLLALAIAFQYKIDASWTRDSKLDRIDGKITLTPTNK